MEKSIPTIEMYILPSFFLVFSTVLTFILYKTAFKDGKPTCERYILNTYVYALFYLGLIGFFISVMLQFPQYYNKLTLGYVIAIFLAYIGLYFAILYIPKESVFLKHMVSILYIFVASILLSSVFYIFFPKSILFSIIMTLVLFILLTMIAWKFQHKLASSIPLFMVLIFFGLIIAEFTISLLYPGSLLEKGIILVVLMVICYLVLVKTKRMIENEKTCTSEGGPDYVRESMGFILSFQNLLLRILELFGKRRRRF